MQRTLIAGFPLIQRNGILEAPTFPSGDGSGLREIMNTHIQNGLTITFLHIVSLSSEIELYGIGSQTQQRQL